MAVSTGTVTKNKLVWEWDKHEGMADVGAGADAVGVAAGDGAAGRRAGSAGGAGGERLGRHAGRQDDHRRKALSVAEHRAGHPRLGVPAYNWWTESLHGALGPVPTTNFPEPVGLAATFDDALVGRAAQAISREVRGLHALARQTGRLGRIGTGLDSWSPNINIFRDPRWGGGRKPMAKTRS